MTYEIKFKGTKKGALRRKIWDFAGEYEAKNKAEALANIAKEYDNVTIEKVTVIIEV